MKIRPLGIVALLSLTLVSACHESAQGVAMDKARMDYRSGNYTKAFQDLERLATLGDPHAMYVLGYLYYYGQGIAKDYDLARAWIKRSADKGYPRAIEAYKMMIQENGYQYGALGGRTRETDRIEKKYKKILNPPNAFPVISQKDRDLSWIRSQSPNHCTIRLKTNNDKILSALGPQQIVEFSYRQNNKTSVGRVLGTFPDQRTAERAKATLPPELYKVAEVETWGEIQAVMLP